MTPVDQSADPGFHKLHRYIRLYPFPDFAKQAQLSEIVGPDQPHSRKYADVRYPFQFPCHTKAATYVSHVYYLAQRDEINPKVRELIEDRLQKFAEYWSITNAIRKLNEQFDTMAKEASQQLPDSAYALVWLSDEGNKARHYPLRNALEVKAAAEWFHQYHPQLREQFSFMDRRNIAERILDKAAEFGANVTAQRELLDKAAGHGFCDPKQASKLIKNRLVVAGRIKPEIKTGMSKLAEAVVNSKDMCLDPEKMVQLAHTIDQFDRSHGLLNKYSSTFQSPEDALFSVTYEKAAEFVREACTIMTGSVYDRNDFTKLSRSDLGSLFGSELLKEVCPGLLVDPIKMAEVAATFPWPEAKLLDQLMREKGILPMAKEATGGIGFTHRQLQTMAAGN